MNLSNTPENIMFGVSETYRNAFKHSKADDTRGNFLSSVAWALPNENG